MLISSWRVPTNHPFLPASRDHHPNASLHRARERSTPVVLYMQVKSLLLLSEHPSEENSTLMHLHLLFRCKIYDSGAQQVWAPYFHFSFTFERQ